MIWSFSTAPPVGVTGRPDEHVTQGAVLPSDDLGVHLGVDVDRQDDPAFLLQFLADDVNAQAVDLRFRHGFAHL